MLYIHKSSWTASSCIMYKKPSGDQLHLFLLCDFAPSTAMFFFPSLTPPNAFLIAKRVLITSFYMDINSKGRLKSYDTTLSSFSGELSSRGIQNFQDSTFDSVEIVLEIFFFQGFLDPGPKLYVIM